MAEIHTADRASRSAGPGLSYWLGTKIYNQPLAMPSALASRLKTALDANAFDPQLNIGFASKFVGTRDQSSRFRVTEDGIALVPVSGVLLDRGDWLGDMGGWATTYEGLAEQFRRLAKDTAIKTVILDIDSGGGMVAGLWDLTAELVKLKKTKKVYAVAANMAASAAYAIGCVAHELYVSRSGVAGSIGVIALHQSYQRLMDAAGIDTTIIAAGEHKADANPYQALSHGARSEMTAEIDTTYDQFVAHVAKHRRIDERAVRDTQARMYSGQAAVDAGLADGVKSIEDLLESLRGPVTGSRGKPQKKGGRALSDPNSPAAEARPDYDGIIAGIVAGMNLQRTQSAPAAQAAAPVPPALAAAQVVPAAKTNEKARLKAILTSEAAKTRPAFANYLALEKDFDAETSIELLGKAPVETPGDGSAANGMGAALGAAMAQGGSSAQVRPEATSNGAKPSLAEKMKARSASKKGN